MTQVSDFHRYCCVQPLKGPTHTAFFPHFCKKVAQRFCRLLSLHRVAGTKNLGDVHDGSLAIDQSEHIRIDRMDYAGGLKGLDEGNSVV